MSIRIGISGAQGSFSEQAARRYTELASIADWEPIYLVSVKNVLEALKNGSVERGIFPIENSNGGIVIEAVHAMAHYTFEIERLFEIDVHHCLLVRKGVHASDITLIVSHDQALKQCRMYVKRRFPDVELQEYADTAQSAHDLGKPPHLQDCPATSTRPDGAQQACRCGGKGQHLTQHMQQGERDSSCPWCADKQITGGGEVRCSPKGILPRTTAVIAHKGCAELYGLDILEESIQDLKFNFTTFVAATSDATM